MKLINKERTIAFTDAILAIIMTILVLELPQPETITLYNLWELKANYFAYAVSFFGLAGMWVSWNKEMQEVEKLSDKTILFTILILFIMSFYPYTTKLVSADFNNPVAQGFYGIIVVLSTLCNYIMYKSLTEIKENENMKITFNSRTRLLSVNIVIVIVSFVLSITIYPPIMMFGLLIVSVTYNMPMKWFETKK